MADDIPVEPTPPPPPAPTPAPQTFQPAPDPASPASALPPNVAAGLACLLPIAGGIIFLVIEKQNKFVRFYAMQSLILGVAMVVLDIVFGIMVHFPVLGHLFAIASWVLHIVFLAIWLIQLIQAFSGKEWEIPYIGPFARKQLGTLPPVV